MEGETGVFLVAAMFILMATAERWGPWLVRWGLIIIMLARSMAGHDEEDI